MAWLVSACAPPPALDTPPEAGEMARLRQALRGTPHVGWSGRGHAALRAEDRELEGTVSARLDPPRRARVELASRALFGMVGERLVVCLPGDDHLLVYRERTDALERVPFAASELARWTACASPQALFELVGGRPPWPDGGPPEDLESRTRVAERRDRGRVLRFRVRLPAAGQVYLLQLKDDALERFEWWANGSLRLDVRYDRWQMLEAHRQPLRMRLRAPEAGVEAEVTLEHLEARRDFVGRDFEVY